MAEYAKQNPGADSLGANTKTAAPQKPAGQYCGGVFGGVFGGVSDSGFSADQLWDGRPPTRHFDLSGGFVLFRAT
jgi:hypothetical protein